MGKATLQRMDVAGYIPEMVATAADCGWLPHSYSPHKICVNMCVCSQVEWTSRDVNKFARLEETMTEQLDIYLQTVRVGRGHRGGGRWEGTDGWMGGHWSFEWANARPSHSGPVLVYHEPLTALLLSGFSSHRKPSSLLPPVPLPAGGGEASGEGGERPHRQDQPHGHAGRGATCGGRTNVVCPRQPVTNCCGGPRRGHA